MTQLIRGLEVFWEMTLRSLSPFFFCSQAERRRSETNLNFAVQPCHLTDTGLTVSLHRIWHFNKSHVHRFPVINWHFWYYYSVCASHNLGMLGNFGLFSSIAPGTLIIDSCQLSTFNHRPSAVDGHCTFGLECFNCYLRSAYSGLSTVAFNCQLSTVNCPLTIALDCQLATVNCQLNGRPQLSAVDCHS